MTIKIKYEVAISKGTGYSETKSFDTLEEAKEYEAILLLADVIYNNITVYISAQQAEALAAHILKYMKEVNNKAVEAESKAMDAAIYAEQDEVERTL